MGTISMRRKSRQDELRKVAVGSEMLYGGITGSKAIFAVLEVPVCLAEEGMLGVLCSTSADLRAGGVG